MCVCVCFGQNFVFYSFGQWATRGGRGNTLRPVFFCVFFLVRFSFVSLPFISVTRCVLFFVFVFNSDD